MGTSKNSKSTIKNCVFIPLPHGRVAQIEIAISQALIAIIKCRFLGEKHA